jgi:hypothetical protein
MRIRARFRRITKWVGVASCLLLVSSMIASFHSTISWTSGTGRFGFGMRSGAFVLLWLPQVSQAQPRKHLTRGFSVTSHGWHFRSDYLVMPRYESTTWATGVTVPLWLLLALLAVPVAFVWRRDRRAKPGHCEHCGYNLTGNVSGVCPECGLRLRR